MKELLRKCILKATYKVEYIVIDIHGLFGRIHSKIKLFRWKYLEDLGEK